MSRQSARQKFRFNQPSAGSGESRTAGWEPSAWRHLLASQEGRQKAQQPEWPDQEKLARAESALAELPPLVFAEEIRQLQDQLAEAAAGRAFILQAGDCAEPFDYALARPRADSIRDRLKVFLQMAVTLAYSTGVPTVKIGRIAGQFAKPRSAATETRDGVELPAFRGHMVNDLEFSREARTPDPERLVEAYYHSASTLNLIRAFTKGGYADLDKIHLWNQEFVAASPAGQDYEKIAGQIDLALRGIKAWGLAENLARQGVDFFTSHEGLILNYEQALTRRDSLSGDWYDCSAHMLWIGARTNQLDGPHVEFMRGVKNPIGCKLGPETPPDYVLDLCRALNPGRIPGRLVLISRMGADKVAKSLPPLLEAVKSAGYPVVWQCDPMHGNTYTAKNGAKTRHLETIIEEIDGYFRAHQKAGTWPGGIHLEITGDNVTECLGGSEPVDDGSLDDRYETLCDPRLNGRQSLDLAFRVSEKLLEFRNLS